MKKQKLFDFSRLLRFKTTIVFVTLVVLFFGFAWSALALETGLEYGTYTGLSTQDIRVTIMKIIRVILGLVGIIAIVIIIYAGYVWMTSAGNAERIETAKKILQSAVIGLLIIFFAFSIVSFIINMLEDAGIIPSIPPGPPPPSGCENCDHLGGGIIESVYPVPYAKDVPRDTAIIVTFKEEIKPETVIDISLESEEFCSSGTENPCVGTLAIDDGKPNVRIFKRSEGEDLGYLPANEVNVSSTDGKTFVFKPISPLGDSTTKYYYTTKLTNKLIRLDTDESAFPGVNDYFSWDFEVGTKLDLVPPELGDLFPVPDNSPDSYLAVTGQQATGTITIAKQPRIAQEASVELVTACNDGVTTDPSGCDYSGCCDDSDYSNEESCEAAGETWTDPSPNCGAANDITYEDNDDTFTVLISGNYSGIHSGVLSITNIAPDGQGNVTLTLDFPGTGFSVDPGYFSAAVTADATTRRADLGHGISVILPDGDEVADYQGQTFKINLKPKTNADRLQIADRVYSFVDQNKPNPAENEIKLFGAPGSLGGRQSLVQAIASKINAQTQNPDISATESANTVGLISVESGAAGNFINISTTGDWATITNMSGGVDESTTVSCSANKICDQPRNVIIRMDFSEPVMPNQVSGVVQTNNDNSGLIAGVGSLRTEDFKNIVVQADLDGDGLWEDDEYVSGTFIQSNQYKTVEFVSLQPCEDVQYNSCGDALFCLPINPALDYVKYRVVVETALLGTECSDASQCAGLSYEDGTRYEDETITTEECVAPGAIADTFCGKTAEVRNIFYMKSAAEPGGVVDLALNSFDGNNNGYIEGTESQTGIGAYSINVPVDGTGDDAAWAFYINNRIDINPPEVLKVSPTVSGTGQSLISPITPTFNKLLQSSTVKPGWGYNDGKCTCDPDETNPCNQPGQTCKDVNVSGNYYCINENSPQVYCSRDEECNPNQECDTKRYLTLYDETSRKAGWWVSNSGEDTNICLNEDYRYRDCSAGSTLCGDGGICSIPDGYSDRTIAQIRHTPLLESTQYNAEVASGVKDIYQNCYVPGKGPSGDGPDDLPNVSICDPYPLPEGSGCCGVTAFGQPPAPYCCNGEAYSKDAWEDTVCGGLVERNFK